MSRSSRKKSLHSVRRILVRSKLLEIHTVVNLTTAKEPGLMLEAWGYVGYLINIQPQDKLNLVPPPVLHESVLKMTVRVETGRDRPKNLDTTWFREEVFFNLPAR